jgi:hypothetical protein
LSLQPLLGQPISQGSKVGSWDAAIVVHRKEPFDA